MKKIASGKCARMKKYFSMLFPGGMAGCPRGDDAHLLCPQIRATKGHGFIRLTARDISWLFAGACRNRCPPAAVV
jgi:hypothetical protein